MSREPLDPSWQPQKLPGMLPQFDYVMQTRVTTAPRMVLGNYGGTGQRLMITVTGGDFEGPDLNGRVVPGGTEWPLVRPDGIGTIDARYTLETDDNVFINIRNTGYRYGPPEVMARVAANAEIVDPNLYYFRTYTVFEAPAGRYDWLSRFVFFGIAERHPHLLFVRYYRLK
ncbi:MAG: DUF3237 domain-containing protein [Stellaceae bacterium]